MTEPELKVPPKLSAMPRHVKERIVESLGTADKLNLREVDFRFKEIVGNARIHYEELKMTLRANRVELFWKLTEEKVVELEFLRRPGGYKVIRPLRFPAKSGKGDYRRAAVAKMLSIFKNPKVSVGKLVMRVDSRDTQGSTRESLPYQEQEFKADRKVIFEKIKQILSRKNFRVNVGMLETRLPISERMLLSVLPYLEPGILKSLQLHYQEFSFFLPFAYYLRFDNRLITDTEQWKQLKEVSIEAFVLDIPLENFLHMEKVRLRFSRRPTETMKTIVEKVLQKPTMRECHLFLVTREGFDMTGAREYVKQFKKVPGRVPGPTFCIKNPYEAEKLVTIRISHGNLIDIKRDYL